MYVWWLFVEKLCVLDYFLQCQISGFIWEELHWVIGDYQTGVKEPYPYQNREQTMGTLWSCSRPFRYINSQWKILKQILLLQPCAKINLEFAAKVIHGPVLPDAVMKTRIRRLYDIANILQSLKLIKKVQVTETNGGKKPAFEYTGPNVKSMGKIMIKIVINVNYC